MRRRLFASVLVVAVAVVAAPLGAVAQPATPTPGPGGTPGVTSAAAILVSLQDGAPTGDGGRVLFARRVHDVRAPASLTKVVTALVARDEYRLDEIVTASPLVDQTHGSDLGLEPGMKISVRDLLYSLLLKSANDAGMALAAHHPFGYEYFIQLMNAKARSLGAVQTRLRNPHGLDQIGHVSSAWDMALFTRQLLADPVLADIVATKTHRMPWKDGRTRIFDNHNKLIGRYAGAVGVKTGFTNAAGHCLITAARTPGGTAFTVVLGSQDHYRDSTALLDYGKALEVRFASGGGGLEVGRALAAPPEPPPEDIAAAGISLPGFDHRDDIHWLVLMLALALVTLGTIGFRRRSDPLRDAADILVWVERLVPGSERRR